MLNTRQLNMFQSCFLRLHWRKNCWPTLHMKWQLFSARFFFFLEWNALRNIMEIFVIYFMIKTVLACLLFSRRTSIWRHLWEKPADPVHIALRRKQPTISIEYFCLLSNEDFDKLRIDSAPPYDHLYSHLCVLYPFPLSRQPNPTSYVNVSVISRNKTTQGR